MGDSREMREILYPASKPFNEGTIQAGEYTLPYQEYGNPKGIPIVYLHGGPGVGSSDYFHRFFDPKAFHIIVYDQRGAGKSTPAGGVKNNTPDLLAQDLDALRDHLGIDKWHVYGGSWGSTLALLYAETYPEHTSSLTLRGIYMLRQKDDDLFYQSAGLNVPQDLERFINFLPEKERGDYIESYYHRLFNPDPAVHVPASKEIARLGNVTYSLERMPEKDLSAYDPADINAQRIEWSIIRNHKFTPQDRLIRDAHKIRHIPTLIVQGRYDMICPPQIAADLKKALPGAEMQMVTSGHAAVDPETMKALIQATNRIRDTGSPLHKKRLPRQALGKKPPRTP